MAWFLHITSLPGDYKGHLDPVLDKTNRETRQGEIYCDFVSTQGIQCDYHGTPAQVGIHKYHIHDWLNPIKATILNNECPYCGLALASTKSARTHAHKA